MNIVPLNVLNGQAYLADIHNRQVKGKYKLDFTEIKKIYIVRYIINFDTKEKKVANIINFKLTLISEILIRM